MTYMGAMAESAINNEIRAWRKDQAQQAERTEKWLAAIHAQLVETNRILNATRVAAMPPPAG